MLNAITTKPNQYTQLQVESRPVNVMFSLRKLGSQCSICVTQCVQLDVASYVLT